MELRSNTFVDGEALPTKCAFSKPHPEDRTSLADNVNPHLAWDDPPEGTKSFALISHDYDVPSVGDDVNRPDREVPADLPRVDFFHWVLIDIPPDEGEIAEGQFCRGVTAGGKDVRRGPWGTRQGLNDFTGWFEGDPEMGGHYFGYDGPAPPWNDSITHHYVFTVYALDTDRLDVAGDFTGQDVRDAIQGHILDQASIEGTYTQNPRLAV